MVGGGGEGGFGAFEEAGHGEDEFAGGAVFVNVEVGELEARGILRLAVINDADGVLDQGEWPFFKAGAPGPDYESTWSGSLTRSGSTPISIAGAVAPYAGENPDSLLFLCPAHSQFVRRFRSKNFAVDATYSSYITRGRNTTGAAATMLGKQFGSTVGHAILSCFFMHDPGSNPAYGYTISPHTDKWPVLYGDGHVIVATKPDWLNLDSPPDVWGSTGQQIKFWRYFDTLK